MSLIIITTILAMHMSMTAIHATPPQSNPSAPSSADISALEQKASILDRKVEFWTRFSFWFVTLTACAAVGYGLGQRFQVVRSRQAAQAHADLSAAKDRVNAETIERVRADASTESKRIESQAKKDIEAANKRSDGISAEAKLEAARLTAQNLATESRLEAERGQRAELEKSIAPRWLENISGSDIAALKKFAGVHVRIDTSVEQEPRLAANQIGNLVVLAGWKLDMIGPTFGGNEIDLFDGVVLLPQRWKLHLTQPPTGDAERRAIIQRWAKIDPVSAFTDDAATALGDVLASNGWTFRKQTDWKDAPAEPDIPESIITIRVGSKPNPYFFTEEMKQTQARYRQAMDEATRIEKETRRKIQEEEMLRAKPPLVLRPSEPDKR